MTLILTFVTPFEVLQVSDRLVTTSQKAFDAFANKSLVFAASNAIVTIGYSGAAYIDGVPTDQWIAEQLLDQRFSTQATLRVKSGPGVKLENIDLVVERVRTRLISAFGKMGAPDIEQTMVVAGLQWNRKRIRPTISIVSNSLGTRGLFLTTRTHRQTFLPTGGSPERRETPTVLVDIPPGYLDQTEKRALLGSVAAIEDIDQCERALVDAIRTVSDRTRTVGADCMSVLIRNQEQGTVRIRYLPKFEYRHRVQTSAGEMMLPAAFSPWFVHPNMTMQPSIMVGGGWRTIGGISVEMNAPPLPESSPGIAAFARQRRMPSPMDPRPTERSASHTPPRARD